MRDTAMSLLLKTNIVISKWIDCERELRRLRTRTNCGKVRDVEGILSTMYFDGLLLISKIYEAGLSRQGRLSKLLSFSSFSPSFPLHFPRFPFC